MEIIYTLWHFITYYFVYVISFEHHKVLKYVGLLQYSPPHTQVIEVLERNGEKLKIYMLSEMEIISDLEVISRIN